MEISTGTRLGPYQIISRLGAGGMGEVWRAHDSRLERDIAIKVLPAVFAADTQFRIRFDREAKTISQLNHPHICSIYDVGDGYLAMELLEGRTLREQLDDGGVSPRKAIEYAIQIANGLAAAHDKGIIHRDLKPENVFITPDGRVKLLDFGLAKVERTEHDPAARTEARVTDPGTVMGTAGYMSPEQVRGAEVDTRTDIFALGAVLYEMLAGVRAFRGGSTADTMSAILREDPPDLSASGVRVSAALERIVRRCLEKNRDERFHSAHDVGFALEAISGTSIAIDAAVVPDRRRPAWWRLGAIAAAVLLIASAVAYQLVRSRGVSGVAKFTPVTFRNGRVTSAAFAPDGQTIVYSATWNGATPELYTSRVGEAESRPLGLRNAEVSAISRTGEMALVISTQATDFTEVRTGTSVLARMPIGGGAPRPVMEDVISADWSSDGKEMAAVVLRDGLSAVEYPLGHELTSRGRYMMARMSPRGDRLALFERDGATISGGAIVSVDLKGTKQVLSDGWNHIQGLAWRPDGKEVWFTAAKRGSARALWAVDLKGGLRQLVTVPGALTLMDISRDGRVLANNLRRRASMTVFDPGTGAERDISWLDFSLIADLADDGRAVLFTEGAEAGGQGGVVYLWDLSQPEPVRLGSGRAVALSRDGRWAMAFDGAAPKTITLIPTGAGLPRKFTVPFTPRWATFLPDGKTALLSGIGEGAPQRVFHMDLSSGVTRPLTPPNAWLCATSPDGSQFVVKDGRTGQALIYSLRDGSSRIVPGIAASTAGDYPLQWSADGRSLFVQATADTEREAVIDLVGIETGVRTPWKRLIASDPASFYNYAADIRITRDGSAYAYSTPRFLTDLYVVDGLRQ